VRTESERERWFKRSLINRVCEEGLTWECLVAAGAQEEDLSLRSRKDEVQEKDLS
jgi:hypothetical protein